MKIRHFGSQCQPDRAALPTHARAAPRHVLVCKLVEVDGRCNICGRCEPGCEHTVEIPAAKFTIACLNTSQYTAAAAKAAAAHFFADRRYLSESEIPVN